MKEPVIHDGNAKREKNELTYQKMGRSKKKKKRKMSKFPARKDIGENQEVCVHDYKQQPS
jgi:hypothetical protein